LLDLFVNSTYKLKSYKCQSTFLQQALLEVLVFIEDTQKTVIRFFKFPQSKEKEEDAVNIFKHKVYLNNISKFNPYLNQNTTHHH
jgi:hypothetical protein